MTRMIGLIAAAVAFQLATVSPSVAVVLFQDNFDSDTPGTISADQQTVTGGTPTNWTSLTAANPPFNNGKIGVVAGGPSGSGNALFLDIQDSANNNPDTIAALIPVINTAGQPNLTVSFDFFGKSTEGVLFNDSMQLWADFGSGFVALLPIVVLGPAGTTSGNPGLPWTAYSSTFANPGSTAAFQIRVTGTAGTEYALMDNFKVEGPVAVPEPSTLGLIGLGLLGLGAMRRRRWWGA